MLLCRTLSTLLVVCSPGFLLAALPPDLAKIERPVIREPKYKTKPGYLLLVFGAEAKHKVWLVLDGDTLYVDRHGSGDLTQPECRVNGEKDRSQTIFKAGDLTLGGRRYSDLQVGFYSAKTAIDSAQADTPMWKEFLAAHPEGKLYFVAIDVPSEKPLFDLRDRTPIKSIRHRAAEYDAKGILQFATRPEEASIIHFGALWTFWPDGQQRLVRGRNEDLVFRLGTPGLGPGTFAYIAYDYLIPDAAKPHLQVAYPTQRPDPKGKSPSPGRTRVQNYVLEDRC